MWKQITGMTIFISTVMFIMFWFNEDFWDFTYGMEDDMFKSGEPTEKCQAFTMLFNIFICLHIFNLVNCREINETKLNPFTALYRNWMFFSIVAAIAAFQYVMVEYGGTIARTSGLTEKQHVYSIMIGSLSLVASFLIKILPNGITRFLVLQVKEKEMIAKYKGSNRFLNWLLNISATDMIDTVAKKGKKNQEKSKLAIEVSDPYAQEQAAENLDKESRA